MAGKATPSQIKDFFSVPGKPVTNTELIDFKKSAPESYEELAIALWEFLQG